MTDHNANDEKPTKLQKELKAATEAFESRAADFAEYANDEKRLREAIRYGLKYGVSPGNTEDLIVQELTCDWQLARQGEKALSESDKLLVEMVRLNRKASVAGTTEVDMLLYVLDRLSAKGE